MMDIVYCGNCSLDTITRNGKTNKTLGGSALNSSIISSISGLKIGIVSTIGYDFDTFIFKNNTFLGDIVTKPSNHFLINEDYDTCHLENTDYLLTPETDDIKTKHLHISFRAGVDVEKILSSNIKYTTLSIDVMKYSLERFLPLIIKYINKIDFIFCNYQEYEILQNIKEISTRLIITNEKKPIIYLGEQLQVFEVPIVDFSIKSTTGAGDSFIGGFLMEWVQGAEIKQCVISGLAASRSCLQVIGNTMLQHDMFTEERNKIVPILESYEIPKTIIVIGNSCAGKTTFTNCLKNIYPIYDDIDDYPPLKEVFDLDDMLREKITKEELLKLKSKFKYIESIIEEYIKNYPNIDYYSSKSTGNGHNIERSILWDLILKYAIQNIKIPYNIIQFSRGSDQSYKEEFGDNAYERSINIILESLPSTDNVLIVNLISELDQRKYRNRERHRLGGHFVAEETMESVYKEDKLFVQLSNIPVCNVNNTKHFEAEFEKEQYFLYNIKQVLLEYNKGGINDGFKEVTKTSVSK